jgi:hypothetical protein
VNERKCRQIVLERSEGVCERCTNVSRGLTCHHRLKKGQGGPWCPTNIVLLCGDGTTPNGCHSFAEHYPNKAAEQGWHVRPWESPAEIPVLYRGSQLAYLTIDGGIEWTT